MGIPFRSCMGQCVGYYRPMLRTARGFKLTDQPRITDYRHCLNNHSRGVSTYASVEVFVDRHYITDLRYSQKTQKTTEVMLTRVKKRWS